VFIEKISMIGNVTGMSQSMEHVFRVPSVEKRLKITGLYLSFAVVKKIAQIYKHPQTFNYTKFHDRYTLNLGFPNAMGLPFVFTLEVPTFVKIAAETSLRSQPDMAQGSDKAVTIPESLNITTSLQFV
jgi:hypothetical protein